MAELARSERTGKGDHRKEIMGRHGSGSLVVEKRLADMVERYKNGADLGWGSWKEVRIPTWLVVNLAIRKSAKTVFGVLLSLKREGDEVKTSEATLAQMAGLKTPKTVRAAIKELVDWNLIRYNQNAGYGGGGNRKTNRYHIVVNPFSSSSGNACRARAGPVRGPQVSCVGAAPACAESKWLYPRSRRRDRVRSDGRR